MRRTERLFRIIQILRAKRGPVTGGALADELGVSLRTLYRDMAELIAQRVPVRGEAGSGYVLDAGYDMPPLMLTADELEAAVLGAAWVARRSDPALAGAARDLIAKIGHAIPPALRPVLLDSALKPITFRPVARETFDAALLRRALRDHRKLALTYRDEAGRESSRILWPVFLAYMDDVRVLVAWCELRADFRHFRTDRILSAEITAARVPERHAVLHARWKARMRETGAQAAGTTA